MHWRMKWRLLHDWLQKSNVEPVDSSDIRKLDPVKVGLWVAEQMTVERMEINVVGDFDENVLLDQLNQVLGSMPLLPLPLPSSLPETRFHRDQLQVTTPANASQNLSTNNESSISLTGVLAAPPRRKVRKQSSHGTLQADLDSISSQSSISSDQKHSDQKHSEEHTSRQSFASTTDSGTDGNMLGKYRSVFHPTNRIGHDIFNPEDHVHFSFDNAGKDYSTYPWILPASSSVMHIPVNQADQSRIAEISQTSTSSALASSVGTTSELESPSSSLTVSDQSSTQASQSLLVNIDPQMDSAATPSTPLANMQLPAISAQTPGLPSAPQSVRFVSTLVNGQVQGLSDRVREAKAAAKAADMAADQAEQQAVTARIAAEVAKKAAKNIAQNAARQTTTDTNELAIPVSGILTRNTVYPSIGEGVNTDAKSWMRPSLTAKTSKATPLVQKAPEILSLLGSEPKTENTAYLSTKETVFSVGNRGKADLAQQYLLSSTVEAPHLIPLVGTEPSSIERPSNNVKGTSKGAKRVLLWDQNKSDGSALRNVSPETHFYPGLETTTNCTMDGLLPDRVFVLMQVFSSADFASRRGHQKALLCNAVLQKTIYDLLRRTHGYTFEVQTSHVTFDLYPRFGYYAIQWSVSEPNADASINAIFDLLSSPDFKFDNTTFIRAKTSLLSALQSELQDSETWLSVLRGVSLPVAVWHETGHLFPSIKDIGSTDVIGGVESLEVEDVNSFFRQHTSNSFRASEEKVKIGVVRTVQTDRDGRAVHAKAGLSEEASAVQWDRESSQEMSVESTGPPRDNRLAANPAPAAIPSSVSRAPTSQSASWASSSQQYEKLPSPVAQQIRFNETSALKQNRSPATVSNSQNLSRVYGVSASLGNLTEGGANVQSTSPPTGFAVTDVARLEQQQEHQEQQEQQEQETVKPSLSFAAGAQKDESRTDGEEKENEAVFGAVDSLNKHGVDGEEEMVAAGDTSRRLLSSYLFKAHAGEIQDQSPTADSSYVGQVPEPGTNVCQWTPS